MISSLRKDVGDKVDWDEVEKVLEGDWDEAEWERIVGSMLSMAGDGEVSSRRLYELIFRLMTKRGSLSGMITLTKRSTIRM